jgi:hypothetical protein
MIYSECIVQDIRSVRALSYPKNGDDTQIIDLDRLLHTLIASPILSFRPTSDIQILIFG